MGVVRQNTRAERLAPLGAAVALAALYDAPLLLLHRVPRPSAEPWLLLGAFALLHAAGRRPQTRASAALLRGLRGSLLLWVAVLVVYRADRVGFLRFLGAEPLLYDQLFMARHLWVLISDLWSLTTLGVVASVIGGLALVVWIGKRLLRRLAAGLDSPQGAPSRRVLAVVASLALACAIADGFVSGVPVRSSTLHLADNLARSARLYLGVQRAIAGVRYPELDRVSLSRERLPDLQLFFVESYGRFVFQHPQLRRAHEAALDEMGARLRADGWHAASGFSRAPVLGGRSWLAEATVLMGTEVRYEAVFRHLVADIERVPNLVRFLSRQGYSTLLLAPADRPRHGVEEVDYYGYDRIVRFDDLGYHGPRMGWGIVPDQYSLGFVMEHVLPEQPRPRFFNFHMVSSHAPWQTIPRMMARWDAFNAWGKEEHDNRERDELERRLRRYTYKARRLPYLEGEAMAARYGGAIAYELELVERHLRELRDDTLVIVLGDHQPPFVSDDNSSLDVPVHLFARDPVWLEELRDHGFIDGLGLRAEHGRNVRHEGLFSALVRTLARGQHDARQLSALPPFRPRGVSLGVEGVDARAR